MPFTTLLLLTLATWRMTHLLVYEDGPWHLVARLRYALGVRYDAHSHAYADTMFGKLLLCVWCASLWVGVALTLLYLLLPPWLWQSVSFPLAFSAGACLLETFYAQQETA